MIVRRRKKIKRKVRRESQNMVQRGTIHAINFQEIKMMTIKITTMLKIESFKHAVEYTLEAGVLSSKAQDLRSFHQAVPFHHQDRLPLTLEQQKSVARPTKLHYTYSQCLKTAKLLAYKQSTLSQFHLIRMSTTRHKHSEQ